MSNDITYSAYGVTLKPLMVADLEFLRVKRNTPGMRQWMTTDHEITREEMSLWYSRLPHDAYYLLIYSDNKCVGHANAKPKGGGIYDPGYMFWDIEFQRQGGVIRAVMAFFNLMFDVVHSVEFQAVTACDNIRALRLARGLGFSKIGITEIDGRSYEQLSLSPERYSVVRRKYEVLFQ